MRKTIVLLGCTGLAACGGGDGAGPTSPGNTAVSAGAGASGSGSTSSLVNPTAAKTYVGVGGEQVFTYQTDDRVAAGQQAQVYAGNTSTVRNSNISIAYDPSSAIFTLAVTDANTGASTQTRFQDPGSRTNFGGSTEPQWGTPRLANTNIHFLQAGDGNPLSPYNSSGSGYLDPGTNSRPPNGDAGASYSSTTFFYQGPGETNAAGTKTSYVTYAGYLRNTVSFGTATASGTPITTNNWSLERGAFAYGDLTTQSAVPTSGTGTYQGGMIATMVMNPTLDGSYGTQLPTYYQWIEGTSSLAINFGTGAVAANFNGTVFAPQIDRYTAPTTSTIAAGTSFAAAGSGHIDLTATGGFTGSMTSASFGSTTNGAPTGVAIAGSTLNGAFYGPGGSPDKIEVGGGFRVVGGTPDQRIDIVGSFAAARTGN